MLDTLASIAVQVTGLYAAIGFVFAVLFVWRGAAAVDPQAAGGTLGFRLLLLPGCAALWPLLLVRWVRRVGPPEEHNPHRDRARWGEVR